MAAKHTIMLYSTPTCPYCHMTRDFFKENKIEYKDINVAQDHARAAEMVQKSGQTGVPVIDIDGKIIVGFDKPALKKVLGL